MNYIKPNAAIILNVIAAHGVMDVVCSPGSRNAPLSIAADRAPQLRTHVVVDEREAAFVALGMAQISRRPVALICTSGTALLNYAPAVAEAYYQSIPLIVISADRPQRWIDQDDSQTLRQPGTLDNFVKQSYDIQDFAHTDIDMCLYANRLANDAVIVATSGRPGPVHINVRLSEPLTSGDDYILPKQRIISCVHGEDMIAKEKVRELAEMAVGKKVMIVAGFMLPDARLNKAMSRLEQLPNVAVLYETTSNLHLRARHWAVDVILSTLDEQERQRLSPDIVITLGGALISRHIKEYLRTTRPLEHWMLGHSHTTVDCFNALTLRLECEPARFISMFGKFMSRHKSDSDYREQWMTARREALKSHHKFVSNAPWSDLKACDAIFSMIPEECNLQLSNGTPVRYAQLSLMRMPHACYCNRGVSGIDGCVSTAIGAAKAYPDTTLLVCGDMSASYDIGALAMHDIPESFKMIVLNNGGGGIFRFISSTRDLSQREKYFCAPPRLPLSELAAAYGFDYFSVESLTQLKKSFPIFIAPRLAPAIMEVRTPSETGGEILLKYMNRDKIL